MSIPEAAEQVARGKLRLSATQVRILIELLPFYMHEMPTSDRHKGDLATQLDKLEQIKRANASSNTVRIYQIEDLSATAPEIHAIKVKAAPIAESGRLELQAFSG